MTFSVKGMTSLIKLWQLTIGHEKKFAEYVRVMCSDTCCNGDLIVRDLSYIIESFNKTPPTYEKYNYFLTDKYALSVLNYVFCWFDNYINGITPDSKWAD